MDLNDAVQLREELEAVEATLLRFKTLWSSDSIPTEDQLDALASAARYIGVSLDHAAEVWQGDNLPTEDQLDELAKAADNIGVSLDHVCDLWCGDGLPSVGQLDEI